MSHNTGIDLIDTINAGCLDTLTRIPLAILLIIFGSYLGVSAAVFTEFTVIYWEQGKLLSPTAISQEILWAPRTILTSLWGLVLAPFCYSAIIFFTRSTNSKVIWSYSLMILWSCIAAFIKIQSALCPYWLLALTMPLWLTPLILLARSQYRLELQNHLSFVENLKNEHKEQSRKIIQKIQQQHIHSPPALADNKPEVPAPSPSNKTESTSNEPTTQNLESRSPLLQEYKDKPTPSRPPITETQSTEKAAVYKIKLNPISKAAILAKQSQPSPNRPTVPSPEPPQ